ncbi:MAG: hypothetical protein JSV66_09960 [Trueperaceae bacterium]|nr:MAG: hypothetical protein JSV66_09960 [Trueperaceae bacterium]
MLNLGHAYVRPHASQRRLRSLVADLKSNGCRIPLNQRESCLDFDISQCELDWIAGGGVEELFNRYSDVVTLNPDFDEIRSIQA